MKTVHNSRMVAHLWAHQAQSNARTSNWNFYFDDDTIYSYGSHFPIARIVTSEHTGETAVLFTTRQYSVTTACHKSVARRAVSHLQIFDVHNPLDSITQENATDWQAYYARSINEQIRKAKTARKYGTVYFDAACILTTQANAFSAFFNLGWTIDSPKSAASIWGEAVARLRQEVLERERQAKFNRREFKRKERVLHRSDFLAWRSGEVVYLPACWHPSDNSALLTIRGDVIYTSQGAEVPVRHAARLFNFVEQCRENRDEVEFGYAEGPRLGVFHLRAIYKNGDVRIGCHFIRWREIARIAKILGWYSSDVEAA